MPLQNERFNGFYGFLPAYFIVLSYVANFLIFFSLSLLEYLQQHLSEQFLESSSWDWPLLRTACQSMLSSEDLVTAQMVEEEENVKEGNWCNVMKTCINIILRIKRWFCN